MYIRYCGYFHYAGIASIAHSNTKEIMRKFIVQQWVTADNIAAEEDGGLSFVTVSPFAEKGDEDLGAASLEFIDTVTL